MLPPTTCWAAAVGAGAQLSVNLHTYSCIKQVGRLFKVTKVTFSSDSSRKMAFWLFLDQI